MEEQEDNTDANDSDDAAPSKQRPRHATKQEMVGLEIVETLET